MRAINHALTGALIGLALPQPLAAIPLAVASHFVCDAIPHFGVGKDSINRPWFKSVLVADALACLLLVLVLAAFRPEYWLLASVTAFLATAPDFMWLPKYVSKLRGHTVGWSNDAALLAFHSKIQWFERPIGAVVELVWAAGAVVLLTLIVR